MLDRRFSIVLFSALLLAAVILGLPNLFPLPRVAAINRSIALVGFVSAWNFTSTPNPTITVNQGDVVSLQLSSGDAIIHRWFVDVDKNGPTPDCPGLDICSSSFTTSTLLTFTVNFAPGTYTYYCSVHPTSMLGQFVVNPPAINRSIALVGFVSAWNFTSTPNPTITVNQGDVVSLQLSSGDAIIHRWFVDVDKNGPTPDCPGLDICSSSFTTSTLLTFTVNFAPGTYTYYCSVHPTSMLGQFVVNPPFPVGGTAVPVDRLALIAPYLGLASALAILVAVATYITWTRRKEKKN